MRRFVILFTFAAIGGCGEEATPAVVRERLSSLVPPVVDGAVAAFDKVKAAPGLAVLGRVLGRVDSMVGKPDAGKAGEPRRGSTRPWSEAQPSDLERRAEASRPNDNETAGQALARKLSDQVFTDAAYLGNGVYRVDGALRVEVTVDGDGLSFALLAGDRAPVVIDLHPETLTATVDVSQIPGDATVAEGLVALRLGSLGDHAWSATVSVHRAVRYQNSRWNVSVAKASPLASATVDFAAGTLAGTVDAGAVTVSAPWDGSVLGVQLGGVTADVSLGDALSIRRLGFGPTTARVTIDCATLLALDWNADAGRVVDFAVGVGFGLDMVTFGPRLGVTLEAHLAPLAAHGKTVPDWLADEIYDFRFGPAFALMGGGIEVLSEQLSIAARKAGAGLTVPAGTCVYGDALTAGEQPLIGRLAARACPAN